MPIRIVMRYVSGIYIALLASLSAAQNNTPRIQSFDILTDLNLRQCVQKIAQTNNWKQPSEVLRIKCHSKKIVSLSGLSSFVNVQKLSLYNNLITVIELDHLTKLQHVNIARNKIKHLKLINLANLTELYAFDNTMLTLTLNNLTGLFKAKFNDNELVEFTHSGLNSLEKLYLFNNKLETMKIHPFPNLTYMDVRQNPMPDELYEDMDKLDNVTIFHDGNEEDWL